MGRTPSGSMSSYILNRGAALHMESGKSRYRYARAWELLLKSVIYAGCAANTCLSFEEEQGTLSSKIIGTIEKLNFIQSWDLH